MGPGRCRLPRIRVMLVRQVCQELAQHGGPQPE